MWNDEPHCYRACSVRTVQYLLMPVAADFTLAMVVFCLLISQRIPEDRRNTFSYLEMAASTGDKHGKGQESVYILPNE
jgi:hypothetical protein